jgi:hypothetical protein
MNVEPVVQPKAAPHWIQGRALRGRIQACDLKLFG